MFAGTLRLFRRQMTGKPIHTASSQITFSKAENILAIGTGFLGLVMLGFEIMSVRDVTKSLGELKVELKNIESRLHAQQERTDALMKIQQEGTDNLYKVLSEEQKQSGERFYSLLREMQKKGRLFLMKDSLSYVISFPVQIIYL